MRTTISSSLLLALLGWPEIAQAAPVTNDATIASAKASPLFKRQLARKTLAKSGLATVKVAGGMEMDFLRYVQDSGLDRRPELVALFDKKLQPGLLAKSPTYTESIYELEDRLVVDRKLVVSLAPGACKKASLPKAIDELCFAKNPKNKPSKGVTKDLAATRKKLAKAPADKIVHGNVTAAQAAKMNDEQLLELLLNSDDRTIHHVSVVPRVGVLSGKKGGLVDFGVKLPKGTATPFVEQSKINVKPVKPGQIYWTGKSFGTKYFLTGFTYGRVYEDSWEYTFADSTWFTDRYYVRFAYHFAPGFGVRVPFSVDVEAKGTGNTRDVKLSVAPVDVDAKGRPAYAAVGLPESKTFGGNEFVLEIKAGCEFYLSIPGPNFEKSCPPVDKSWSRDIDPVIGAESSKIRDWWLEGSTTGLKLDYGIASASLDLGVVADVTNGKIGTRISPLTAESTLRGILSRDLLFTSRTPIAFGVERSAITSSAGFYVDKPTYGFDLRIMPQLRGVIAIDVAIYENSWTLGPFSIDQLAISKGFSLDHHDGTVERHDYKVFTSDRDVLMPNDTARTKKLGPG